MLRTTWIWLLHELRRLVLSLISSFINEPVEHSDDSLFKLAYLCLRIRKHNKLNNYWAIPNIFWAWNFVCAGLLLFICLLTASCSWTSVSSNILNSGMCSYFIYDKGSDCVIIKWTGWCHVLGKFIFNRTSCACKMRIVYYLIRIACSVGHWHLSGCCLNMPWHLWGLLFIRCNLHAHFV